jgi:hypothetical protein
MGFGGCRQVRTFAKSVMGLAGFLILIPASFLSLENRCQAICFQKFSKFGAFVVIAHLN